MHEDLDHILKAGLRGKALVRQILSFNETGEQARQPVQRQSLVEECLNLIRASLPATIDIRNHQTQRCRLAASRYEPILFPKHLPPEIRIQVVRQTLSDPHQQLEASPSETHFKELPPLQNFRESIYTQAERQYLADLMDMTAGDIKAAIRISGLSQSRLYAILKKHHIQRRS